MRRKLRHITSESNAVDVLRRFFTGTLRAESLTPEEVYAAMGRQNLPPFQNSRWLTIKITNLRRHGLVTTEYERGRPGRSGGKRLAKIVLTPKGRAALEAADTAQERGPKRIVPEPTAVWMLRRLFADALAGAPSGDSVTPEEVYAAAGRQSRPHAQNRMWLSGKLTPLKRYGLVTARYCSSYNRLDRILLTPKGKAALDEMNEAKGGAATAVTSQTVPPKSEPAEQSVRPLVTLKSRPELTLESVGAFLRGWQKNNPLFRVTLHIGLRENANEDVAEAQANR